MLETLFVSLLSIVVGFAFCFGGYRYFLYLMPAWGFYAGFILGAHALSIATGEAFLSSLTSWIVAIVAGLILAVLAYLLFPLAIGFLALSLGYQIATGVLTWIGIDATWILVVAGLVTGGALIVLLFTMNLLKPLIIVYTALAGAMAMLSGILILIGRIDPSSLRWGAFAAVVSDQWFWGILWLAIAGAGIGAQIYSSRDFTLMQDVRQRVMQ